VTIALHKFTFTITIKNAMNTGYVRVCGDGQSTSHLREMRCVINYMQEIKRQKTR